MTASDPGSLPDATGRRLAYLPAALIGNGELLVTLSARGEVERMLWPHVDGPNNVGELRLGLATGSAVTWLDEPPWAWSQGWVGDVSILSTTMVEGDTLVNVQDCVDPDEPVLVRRVEAPLPLVIAATPRLAGADDVTGAFVDPASGIVVFHRRQTALAIAVDADVVEADVGSVGEAGDDVAHVAPLEARIEADSSGSVRVVVALGYSPFEALARARRHRAAGADTAARRSLEDGRLLARAAVGTGEGDLERLMRRSVLVLELLTDRATGGVVAAPEMDERFAESGGYGFVWPRDLAFVALGLLAAGRAGAAAAALRWLARTQAPEGLWLQRYWTTGEPAPSWGLHQVDETGVVLVAAEAAFGELGEEELDHALWPVVRRAAEFLVSFLDPVTGLPKASTDLWEQHDGQHTYSAATVAGGLRCAALAAARHEPELRARFAGAAARVATAIDEHLWDEPLGRYRRAVNVARQDGRGLPPDTAFDRRLPYASRRVASVDPNDVTLDSSLLGLVWPVATFGPASARVRATVDAVADGLTTPAGGLLRHDGDAYAGGHEWPIATLWLALARRAFGDAAGHAQALAHVVGRRTSLDLLPEQSLADGRPAWVLPLGWSHAMLLLAARPELRLLQRLREEMTGDGRGG